MWVKQFRNFVEENFQCSELDLVDKIKQGQLDVYKTLNDFVVHLDKTGKKPATIKLAFAAVKGYLRHLGIKIYNEESKYKIKLPKKIRHREEAMTKEILVRLLHILPFKLQTAVLVAIASGMRIGEIVQLKIGDVDFESNPTRIVIRAETTKTKESRETYLTSEATKALKDYLTRYFDWKENSDLSLKDEIIFGPTKKTSVERKAVKSTPTQLAESSLSMSLRAHIKKVPQLNKLNENGRASIHFHAFRKFFRTTVGDAVGRDYAEAIMGHHFYMDTYYNLPDEKKREMYLKAEPYLTISDYTRIEKNLKNMTEKHKELEEQFLEFKRSIEIYGLKFLERS
jgi:integrase